MLPVSKAGLLFQAATVFAVFLPPEIGLFFEEERIGWLYVLLSILMKYGLWIFGDLEQLGTGFLCF
jgi:hypothetical protein